MDDDAHTAKPALRRVVFVFLGRLHLLDVAARASPRKQADSGRATTDGGTALRRPALEPRPVEVRPIRSASAAALLSVLGTIPWAPRRPKEFAELGSPRPRVGVERGQRLVEEELGRIPGDGTRERNPLAFPAGHVSGLAFAR